MAFLKRNWWVLPILAYLALWAGFVVECGISEVPHALERTALHLFSGPGVFLGVFWLQWVADRKLHWFDIRGYAAYVVPCLVASSLIFFREPFDAGGDACWFKSYLDYPSWLLGTGWGGYFTYRVAPYASKLNSQIASARVGRHERSRSRSR